MTEQYGNLIELGIIDPAKVTRSALENASSVAAIILTTDALVTEKPEKAAATPRRRPWRDAGLRLSPSRWPKEHQPVSSRRAPFEEDCGGTVEGAGVVALSTYIEGSDCSTFNRRGACNRRLRSVTATMWCRPFQPWCRRAPAATLPPSSAKFIQLLVYPAALGAPLLVQLLRRGQALPASGRRRWRRCWPQAARRCGRRG